MISGSPKGPAPGEHVAPRRGPCGWTTSQKGTVLIAVLAFASGVGATLVTASISFSAGSRELEARSTAHVSEQLAELEQSSETLARAVRALTSSPEPTFGGSWNAEGPELIEEVRLMREEMSEILAWLETLLLEVPEAEVPEEQITREIDLARNEEAYRGSIDLVDEALTRGRWTVSDAQKLRGSLHSMTRKQQEEVLGSLLPAINRGDIVPEPEALPF